MSERIPAAKHLSSREYAILLATHSMHLRSMGLEKRKNYTLSDIVKVERNYSEKCFNVHYKNGDWWHYRPGGKWD